MVTLGEEKKKALALIEELNPGSEYLTDDPDIRAKINPVVNMVMFELARMKKLPEYTELPVTTGQLVRFRDIGKVCGKEVYQLNSVRGVEHELKAGGTIIKALADGVAEIDCFVYPTPITEETGDEYEFELSRDVLEIMPYGVAADLLKSDESAQYGTVYAKRYTEMLERLDPRYSMGEISFEGGVVI